MSDWYDVSGNPLTGSGGSSQIMRDEFVKVQTADAKLPVLTGNPDTVIFVNSAANALEAKATQAALTLILAGNTLAEDLDYGGFKGVNAGSAVDSTDLTTLSDVNALIVGGGVPGDIAITELDEGTATALQTISVNGAGDAIIGIDPYDGAGLQTIYVPASAMTSRDTDGAADGSFETTTNDVMVITKDFDPVVEEFVQFSVQMPNSWDGGTVAYKILWSHAATTTNFGVAWAIEGLALTTDDAIDTAFGSTAFKVVTGGVTDDLYISSSADMTIANTPEANDWVVFQAHRRVSSGSDTMAIDARLHGVSILYTTTAGTDD